MRYADQVRNVPWHPRCRVEKSKEPALRECTQDESLRDSRDVPGATKTGAAV